MKEGHNKTSEITEQTIVKYYKERGFTTYKSSTVVLMDAFKYSDGYVDGCSFVLFHLPKLKTTIRPYEALDVEEIGKVKAVIDHMGDEFLLRDKAMAKMVYYLGVRGGDIANLKIKDINFEDSRISFIQSKTQVRIDLPLRPVVGNAIVDYIMHERPRCDIGNLFIIHDKKHIRPISTKNVYWVLRKVFNLAQVRVRSGRKGIHIFRHNVASRLIHDGCDSIEVTSILGHVSPEAINAYLSADEQSLKKCAISVEQYPLNLETYKQYL